MTKSKVYFSDFHMPYGGDPLPVKLAKLMKKAGFNDIDFKDKYETCRRGYRNLSLRGSGTN